jgi:hypothetical protein
MALTYTKIASVTVGSGGASSVLFSNIPGTYTDLSIFFSGRTGNVATQSLLVIKINGASTNFTLRYLGQGNSSPLSYTQADFGGANTMGYMPAASTTASTFSNIHIYIPNYAGSTNKSISSDAVMENNSTTIQNGLVAGLWSQTAAITSIQLNEVNSNNLVQYSTATLYGISKA